MCMYENGEKTSSMVNDMLYVRERKMIHFSSSSIEYTYGAIVRWTDLCPSLYRQYLCFCCPLFLLDRKKGRKKLKSKETEFPFEIKSIIKHSKMDNRKKAGLFVLMFVCPFVILGLSIAAAKCSPRNDEVSKKTRDRAQAMYLIITILGLHYPTPETTAGHGTFSFSKAALGTLAASCFLMSVDTFLDFVNNNVLALIDIIANATAFLYLAVLWTVLVYDRKKDTHTA